MICQAQIHLQFDSRECVLQRLVHDIAQSQQLLYKQLRGVAAMT